jgi:hypothetical protein
MYADILRRQFSNYIEADRSDQKLDFGADPLEAATSDGRSRPTTVLTLTAGVARSPSE